jgi:hypothetical protein
MVVTYYSFQINHFFLDQTVINLGSVTPVFYNIGVSILHEKIRGKLNKSVGPIAFFQGIVAFSRE